MSDFYRRLDEKTAANRIERILKGRPKDMHDYQGCTNDKATEYPVPAPTPEPQEEELPRLDTTQEERSHIENMRPMASRNTLIALENLVCRERQLRSSLTREQALQAQVDALTKKVDAVRRGAYLAFSSAVDSSDEWQARAEKAEAEVAALREQLEKQWISVDEKKPECDSGMFLVQYLYKDSHICHMVAAWYAEAFHALSLEVVNVTHYQPLPAPPAPQEKP